MYELKHVCGDPNLPADLTHIPHQPESRPMLAVTAERTDAGDWQGIVTCDDIEVWRGKPWPKLERWRALCDADANRAKILRQVTDGLVEDIHSLDNADEVGG